MKTHGITQDAGFPFLRENSKVGLGFSALAATLPFFHAKLLRVELNVGVIQQVGQRSAQGPGSFWESSIQCERRENSQKLPETIGYWLLAVFAAFSIVTMGVFFFFC